VTHSPRTRFDALIDELCLRFGWCGASSRREALRPLAGDAEALLDAIVRADGYESTLGRELRSRIAERVHDWLFAPAGIGARSGLPVWERGPSDPAEPPRALEMPWLRELLLSALAQLAEREWSREANASELDELLDFFDDSAVLDDPPECVGLFLYDADEARAITRLAAELDRVIAIRGPAAWDGVAKAACAALARLRAEDVRRAPWRFR
jgi:hypothetical protein